MEKECSGFDVEITTQHLIIRVFDDDDNSLSAEISVDTMDHIIQHWNQRQHRAMVENIIMSTIEAWNGEGDAIEEERQRIYGQHDTYSVRKERQRQREVCDG